MIMSSRTASEHDLKIAVEKSLGSDQDRHKVKTSLKTCLQGLGFIKKGLKLQVSDPSYKLRYLYALNFWRKETGNDVISRAEANELIIRLKKELNSKDCVYSEDEAFDIILDDFFSKESLGKDRREKEESSANRSNEKSVWYVTSKTCDNAFYVKSSNKAEAEERINIKEIVCYYKLICPGDEVQVIRDNSIIQSVNITKSKGLDRSEISGEKARFIADLQTIFLQDESGLAVVEILRTRFQGLWNYIKNDEELFKDVQCVKNLLGLSFELSQKLSKISKESCKWFLEDLSSSIFLTAVLPAFIQNHDKELSEDDDIKRLKILLELMMEFSPHTASKTLDVAKHLADVMYTDSTGGNFPEENLKCNAIEYVVHLGEILAKSGFEDDDTSECVSTLCYRSVTREEKAKFITDLMTLFSEGESVLIIVYKLRTSSENIWNQVKNDKVLFQDDECVQNLIQLSSELSQELDKKSKVSCKWFLEDLSSSSFFTAVLPNFIDQNYYRDLSRGEDINRLKSLLELMMEFSPHTATKILDVAKHLADVMQTNNTGENFTEEKSKCSGVEYLIRLEKILSKSVSGCQDVDTTNCRWNELPTIPTKKEIFSAFDLRSLEAIKEYEPYESLEQYLDINYRLLREECFRNLCTGIQDFLELKRYDAQKMKMYRIKLNTINASKSQIFLVLNCEDYHQDENNDSLEEQVYTSNDMLYGSLMCISLNKEFDSLIWATVEGYELQRDSNIKLVSVRLCSDRNTIKNIEVLLELTVITNKGDYALMAESPTFYNAFGPCMDRLQKTYQNGDMPLVDELVFAKKSLLPSYTCDKEQKCDWSIIFDKPPGYDFTFPEDRKLSPIEQYKYLKETAELSPLLDETQQLAVENFLQNRVSIIQGPPGTGKSFLGVKILRLMLSMEIHKRFDGPILIMTCKNVALDHFLEACLKYTPKIVRIGKETNETLSKINLRNVPHQKGIKKLKAMNNEARTNMRTTQLIELFKCLSSKTFTVQLFLKAASKVHVHSLLTMSNDLDQNMDDATADRLLRKWEQKGVPKELEERLIGSLNHWLPKTKMQERYQDKEADSNYHEKTRSSSSSTNADDDEDDSLDRKVVNKDRQLDALEEDDIDENNSESEDSGDDAPSTDDEKIPFFYTNETGLDKEFEEDLNLWTLSDDERIDFICSLLRKIVCEFSEAVSFYEKYAEWQKDIRNDRDVSILKEYDVIGMTVSGAATRLHLLDQLKPCAVIVEEAAGIIEGQLVSVLPPSIQHLVMLGDQEQLKPHINCYQLKKKKHLDCSLFERLINNGMNYTQLGQQCRMRDDIADLLRELKIYKDLRTNHEKTRNNVPPECIESSLYFVKHIGLESNVAGTKSLCNKKEISLILDVAEKLMKNGYPPGDVTVLCPYRGQVIKMKSAFESKSSDPSEEYFKKLKDINITTVDSFQGEERKVILLSLVRSNGEQKIGFLAVRNRICVAISRAQCGLYIFGNSVVYQTSPNWKKIIDLLTEKRKVGRFIPFKEDAKDNCAGHEEKERNEEQKKQPGPSNHVRVDGAKGPTVIGDHTTINHDCSRTVIINQTNIFQSGNAESPEKKSKDEDEIGSEYPTTDIPDLNSFSDIHGGQKSCSIRFDPDDESELPNNTSNEVNLRGKDMRFLKDRECINGENHSTQENCRAVVPVYTTENRSAQITTKEAAGVSSSTKESSDGQTTFKTEDMRRRENLCNHFAKEIKKQFLKKLKINTDDLDNPGAGTTVNILSDARTVTSVLLSVATGAAIPLSLGSFGIGAFVGAAFLGVTFTAIKADKRKKKAKAKQLNNKVEIFLQHTLKCIIKDVARELSRMFEFQVLELNDERQIGTLAECAVNLMLQLKEGEKFNRNTLLKKVLQDAKVDKTELQTRNNDKWFDLDVFRKPGLRKVVLEDDDARFEYYVKPAKDNKKNACDTEKYGYRGQFLEILSQADSDGEEEKGKGVSKKKNRIKSCFFRSSKTKDEADTSETVCDCMEACTGENHENCSIKHRYFRESDIDSQYKEPREPIRVYRPMHILIQCPKVFDSFNQLQNQKPSLANFLKEMLHLPNDHLVLPVYRPHSARKILDLSNSDLTGSDLTHSDFTKSVLERCNFTNVVMLFAELGAAKMSHSKFCKTRISHSVLVETIAEECKWVAAKLHYSRVERAKLSKRVRGSDCSWKGTNIDEAES